MSGGKRRRKRLDVLLVERELAPSRARAQALIMAGRVLVDDQPGVKAGAQVSVDAQVRLRGDDPIPFVSRGGVKLDGALERFGLDVRGRVAIDVGASTGGFTDCLLQRGARKVFAVDVGYGQLAWSLRQDPRVVNIERTNIRALDPAQLDEAVEVAVADVSFISVEKVIPHVLPLLRPGADMVLLIKPQFEVGKGRVGKGGVVRDPALRAETIARVVDALVALGLRYVAGADSSLAGPSGNLEHLVWLRWQPASEETSAPRQARGGPSPDEP